MNAAASGGSVSSPNESSQVWIAADAGCVVDPDGLANQLEGGAIQAISWTLKEAVGFDADGVTTDDWDSYPILRFSEVPRVSTALIDRHPDTRFVIDHLGLLQPYDPPAPAEPWADLPKVLDLASRPNAVIKVTGACTLSHQPYPFDDIWDPLARVFDAWGMERCLWGTDWTRAFAVVNFEQAVEPFRLTDRLSAEERAMLMGGACARTYGWSPGMA